MLTVTQVAERLGLHRNTVRGWVLRGQLPALIVPGGPKRRTIRINPNDVATFIANATTTALLSNDTRELIEWMDEQGRSITGLCPRCGRHNIDPASVAEWCTECTLERQIADDAEAEREKARKRRWFEANGTEWRNARKAAARADTEQTA